MISWFLDDFCHALHFVVTYVYTTFYKTYCLPLQISPKKIEKHVFYIEILRRKNGINLVQNRSIEFEIVYLDRFCCPIGLTIIIQNLCTVFLSNKVNSWNPMEIPRLYLFVFGK